MKKSLPLLLGYFQSTYFIPMNQNRQWTRVHKCGVTSMARQTVKKTLPFGRKLISFIQHHVTNSKKQMSEQKGSKPT
jgi:hypothetical protein